MTCLRLFYDAVKSSTPCLICTTFLLLATRPTPVRVDIRILIVALSEDSWSRVLRMFGPHTFDLMALDRNYHRGQFGNRLPHFTPCQTPETSGINVFAQHLPTEGNLYVFPRFVLIGPLLRFFIDSHYRPPFTSGKRVFIPYSC